MLINPVIYPPSIAGGKEYSYNQYYNSSLFKHIMPPVKSLRLTKSLL